MSPEMLQIFIWCQITLDVVLVCGLVGLWVVWKVSLVTVTRSAEFRESVAASVEGKIHDLTARQEAVENSWRDWHEKHNRIASRISKVEGLQKARDSASQNADDGLEIAGPPVDLATITGSLSDSSSDAERDEARRRLTAHIHLGKR